MEKENKEIDFSIIEDKILLNCIKNICKYYKKDYNVINDYLKNNNN